MKIYTCAKPTTIGGQHFIIGETIPGELIAPEREKALVRFGVLAVSEAAQMPDGPGITKDTVKEPDPPAEPPTVPDAPDTPDTPNEPEPTAATENPATTDAGNESAAKPGRKVQK